MNYFLKRVATALIVASVFVLPSGVSAYTTRAECIAEVVSIITLAQGLLSPGIELNSSQTAQVAGLIQDASVLLTRCRTVPADITTPTAFADLIVQDVIVSPTFNINGGVITAQIKNNGAVAAPASVVRFELWTTGNSLNGIDKARNVPALAPGQVTTVEAGYDNLGARPSLGYNLKVLLDINTSVDEGTAGGETNNYNNIYGPSSSIWPTVVPTTPVAVVSGQALSVTNFTAVRRANGTITLNWTKPATFPSSSSYQIYRRTSSVLGDYLTPSVSIDSTRDSYADMGTDMGTIDPNTTYYYWIYVVNFDDQSKNSPPVTASASVLSAVAPSISTFIVPMSAQSGTSIQLQYGATGSNLSNYNWRVMAVCPSGVSVYTTEGDYCRTETAPVSQRSSLGVLSSSAQAISLQVRNSTGGNQQVQFRLSITQGSGSAESEVRYLGNSMTVGVVSPPAGTPAPDPAIDNITTDSANSLNNRISWNYTPPAGKSVVYYQILRKATNDKPQQGTFSNCDGSSAHDTFVNEKWALNCAGTIAGNAKSDKAISLPKSLFTGNQYVWVRAIISSSGTDYEISSSSWSEGKIVTGGVVVTPPTLAFYATPNVFIVGTAITSPQHSVNGSDTTYTVSPSLPAGLSLTNTGDIMGTPTTAKTATNYTITATNAGGSAQATISITVTAPVSATTRLYPQNDIDSSISSTAGNCAGLISWWWNETTGGNFANGDRNILCYNGRFYSPGRNWGGQAYPVDSCVQKGPFYSKIESGSTIGVWMTGSKTTDPTCSPTSLNSLQKSQMASVLSSIEAILKAMKAGLR